MKYEQIEFLSKEKVECTCLSVIPVSVKTGYGTDEVIYRDECCNVDGVFDSEEEYIDELNTIFDVNGFLDKALKQISEKYRYRKPYDYDPYNNKTYVHTNSGNEPCKVFF